MIHAVLLHLFVLLLAAASPAIAQQYPVIPAVDYTFVDSRQGKRLEVELTAGIGHSS